MDIFKGGIARSNTEKGCTLQALYIILCVYRNCKGFPGKGLVYDSVSFDRGNLGGELGEYTT